MKYRLLPFGLLIGASSLFGGDDWSMNNHFTVYGDFIYMQREDLHNKTMIRERHFNRDSKQFYTKPALRSRDLLHKFDWEPGFRVGATFMERTWSVDGSYLFINGWHAKTKIEDDHAGLSYPFKQNASTKVREAFSHADQGTGKYKSQFWTAELNYWRHVTPRRMDYFSFSWIAGVRYVQLDEDTSVTLKKRRENAWSRYHIESRNFLPGPQLGLNIQVNPYRQWSWDFTGKIGGLLDYQQQNTSVKTNTEKFRGGKNHDFSTTLLLDLSASLSWNFWRHGSIRLGYEVYYISGVNLAPENYKRTTSESRIIQTEAKGEVLINGLFAGLALSF